MIKRICLSLPYFLLCFNVGLSQWVQTNGPEGGFVNCFAVNGTNVFAGSQGGGVFLSTNGGASWSTVNNGLTNTYVSCLVASGNNLFVGTMHGGGVFLSTDNGASWSAVSGGLMNKYVYSLAVSGTNVFAGTGGGIFISTNNGTNWSRANSGLFNATVQSIAASGTNLFIAAGPAVYFSTNNGKTWTNTSVLDAEVRALALSGTNVFAGTWLKGVFRSTDNGASWSASNVGLTGKLVSALAVNGANLFAATQDSGVFLSTNNGGNWTPINNGLTSALVTAFGISGTSVFAGTSSGGVFLSTNNGTSWTAVNTGLTDTYVNALAVSGMNLFAGTQSGVFLSTDNGTSWTTLNSGLTYKNAHALAVSGTSIFAGSSGVFVSTNSGTNWAATSLTNHQVTAILINGANVFAGTLEGLFVSTNGGTSWTAANSGLTNTVVWSLAVSDTNVFAGTEGGVFLSTNNGMSWRPFDIGLTSRSVQSFAVVGRNLFAGASRAGVWRRPLSQTSISAPSVPMLVSPTNGFTGVPITSMISWNTSAQATSYQLQVSTDSTFSTTIVNRTNITDTSYPVSGLADNTRYYWRVSAANAGGVSAYSGSWIFTTSFGVSLTPKTLSFGNLPLGTSKSLASILRYGGRDTLLVTNIVSMNPRFTLDRIQLNAFAGKDESINVTFTPATTGQVSSLILVFHNLHLPTSADTIRVSGAGIAVPIAQIAPKNISFGNVLTRRFKDTVLTISNVGAQTLQISNVVPSHAAFVVRQSSIAISPGQAFVDTITFTPIAPGPASGLLLLLSNSITSPDTVRVDGVGTTSSYEEKGEKVPRLSVLSGSKFPQSV